MDGFTPFQLEGLRVHNEHRRKHGVAPLKLSHWLCAIAQKWVNNIANWGTLQHSSFDQRGGTGENLFGGNCWFATSDIDLAKSATDAWYNEVKYWNYNNGGFSMQTGHFTQVVWKNTTELGIAKARGQMGDFVCANYDPPGNFQGQFQSNVPRPVSLPASTPKEPEKPKEPTQEQNFEENVQIVQCDGCSIQIKGQLRSKCVICPEFDLCKPCTKTHEHDHKDFWRITENSPQVTSPRTPWVSSSMGHFQEKSLIAGDGGPNGCDVIVARANLNGNLIPGKVLPTHGVCYVAWDGKEHALDSYETLLLQDKDVGWLPSKYGEFVPRALLGGITGEGQVLFIGRVFREGEVVVGRIDPRLNALFVSYGGREISYSNYDILVLKDLER